MSNRTEVIADAVAEAAAEIPGFAVSETSDNVYGGSFFTVAYRGRNFEIVVQEQK